MFAVEEIFEQYHQKTQFYLKLCYDYTFRQKVLELTSAIITPRDLVEMDTII